MVVGSGHNLDFLLISVNYVGGTVVISLVIAKMPDVNSVLILSCVNKFSSGCSGG